MPWKVTRPDRTLIGVFPTANDAYVAKAHALADALNRTNAIPPRERTDQEHWSRRKDLYRVTKI